MKVAVINVDAVALGLLWDDWLPTCLWPGKLLYWRAEAREEAMVFIVAVWEKDVICVIRVEGIFTTDM